MVKKLSAQFNRLGMVSGRAILPLTTFYRPRPVASLIRYANIGDEHLSSDAAITFYLTDLDR